MNIRKVIRSRIKQFQRDGILKSFKYLIFEPMNIIKSEIMNENHIYEHIWLGNAKDARKFDGDSISVRGEDVDREFNGTIPFSILKIMQTGTPEETKQFFNMLVETIDIANNDTLIYCTSGIDRSPFVVMCWLVLKKGFDVESAYRLIAERRPIICKHYEWVEILIKKGIFTRLL